MLTTTRVFVMEGFAREAKISKVAIQALVALRYQPSQPTCIRIPHPQALQAGTARCFLTLHTSAVGVLRCGGCIDVNDG